PIIAALRCSGQRVTSWPSMLIFPRSTKNPPPMEFNNVYLPDPFVPIMTTNPPWSRVRFTPCREWTSFGVPALKVLCTSRTSSMGRLPLACLVDLLQQPRRDQRQEHEDGCYQFEVVRIETP